MLLFETTKVNKYHIFVWFVGFLFNMADVFVMNLLFATCSVLVSGVSVISTCEWLLMMENWTEPVALSIRWL